MSSRLTFRPRPLDIHKKLPIVKSVKDLDSDEGVSRTVQHNHIALDAENELVCIYLILLPLQSCLRLWSRDFSLQPCPIFECRNFLCTAFLSVYDMWKTCLPPTVIF